MKLHLHILPNKPTNVLFLLQLHIPHWAMKVFGLHFQHRTRIDRKPNNRTVDQITYVPEKLSLFTNVSIQLDE